LQTRHKLVFCQYCKDVFLAWHWLSGNDVGFGDTRPPSGIDADFFSNPSVHATIKQTATVEKGILAGSEL